MEHQQKPKSIERAFPKKLENNEIKNVLNRFKKLMEKIDRSDLKYETITYIYDFQQFKTIKYFGGSI